MPGHEIKICGHCGEKFECKVGDVFNCQCSKVSINENERKYMAKFYSDCLCAKCMLLLKKQYVSAQK